MRRILGCLAVIAVADYVIVRHPETEFVEPGEIVLTNGHYTLIHDANVRLVENVAAEGGRPS